MSTFTFPEREPTGLVGKRDQGELVVLGLGLAAGLVLSLVPWPLVWLRMLLFLPPPIAALTFVFKPYAPAGCQTKRTRYRYWQAKRARRRLLKTGMATWRNLAREAGVDVDSGQAPQVPPPPGVGEVRWLHST